MKQRQIFAIGGRFYVDTWEPPLLQRHLLSLSSAPSPKMKGEQPEAEDHSGSAMPLR